MMTRIPAILLLTLLCCCGEKVKEPQPALAPSPDIPTTLVDERDFSGANAMYHAAKLVAIGDRSTGSPGYRQQLDYLKHQLSAYGWTTEEQAFTLDTVRGEVTFVNLRARLGPAPDFPTSARLVVSCHIDTKTNIEGFVGANDGASGAAVILELSRILAKTPSLANGVELVFFDGEESFAPNITDSDGLYGSTWYVNKLTEPLPSWLINLDMVGRQGMKIRIPPDTPQVLYRHYTEAIAELQLRRSAWGVSTYGIIDDHVPFVKRGIPSINIIDDFNDGDWWHTAGDNLSILSADSMQQSGRVTLFLIKRLAD